MKHEGHILKIDDVATLFNCTVTLDSFELCGVKKVLIDDIPLEDLLESRRILKRLLKMGRVASGVMDPTETSEPEPEKDDKPKECWFCNKPATKKYIPVVKIEVSGLIPMDLSLKDSEYRFMCDDHPLSYKCVEYTTERK